LPGEDLDRGGNEYWYPGDACSNDPDHIIRALSIEDGVREESLARPQMNRQRERSTYQAATPSPSAEVITPLTSSRCKRVLVRFSVE
jgi:hypothetical protein